MLQGSNTGLGIHIVGLTDAAGLGIHIVGLTDAAGVCNTRNMLSTILHVLEVLQLVNPNPRGQGP